MTVMPLASAALRYTLCIRNKVRCICSSWTKKKMECRGKPFRKETDGTDYVDNFT